MKKGKLNIGLLLALLVLIALSVLLVSNLGNVKEITHQVLIWPNLTFCFWLLVAVCYIIYGLSPASRTQGQSTLIYKMFGRFADTSFTVGTLGVCGTTSLALLKGVYVQSIMESEIYFTHFNELDIFSLFVVALFLLVYSLRMSFNALYISIINSRAVTAKPGQQ